MNTRLAIIVVLLAGMCSAFSQPPIWKSVGSQTYLTSVSSIVVNDKGTIFACGMGKLIRSTNNGQQWDYPLSDTLFPAAVVTVGDSYVFAACHSGGVFISKDNGDTWAAANNGITDLSTFCITKDQSGNLVVGTQKGNVFRSVDNGKTWVQLGGTLAELDYLDVGPSGTVYAGGRSTGLYLWSENAWKKVLAPNLSSFALDSEENLYAGVWNDAQTEHYITVSTTRGATWTKVKSLTGYAYVAVRRDTVYAGANHQLYRSTDKGTTWSAMNCPSTITISALAYFAGQMFMIGDVGGKIFLSKDGGATWSEISSTDGLTSDAAVQSLQANSRGDLFITGGMGVSYIWRSTDGGDHWKLVNVNGVRPEYPFHLSSDDILYAKDASDIGSSTVYVYRSLDNGNTWTRLVNAPGRVMGSGPAGCVFAQRFGPGQHGAKLTYDLQRSLDRGETWESVGFNGNKVSSITYVGDSVFLAVASGALYQSADLGRSWLAADPIISGAIRSITTGISGAIFVAGDNGVFVSLDHGKNWKQSTIGSNILPVYTAAVNFEGRVFAGTQRGVYLSLDNGGTWQPAGLDSLNVTAIICGLHHEALATTSGGLFCAKDDSLQWVNINAGVPAGNRTSILLTSDGFAYTTWPMVYKTRVAISQIDSLIHAKVMELPLPPSQKPSEYHLGQNYPNPFNPSTTIAFSLPERSHVSLKVFDVMGREVSTIVSEELPAGTYQRQWNASGMSSGVYFYRLQAGVYSETKRLIVLK